MRNLSDQDQRALWLAEHLQKAVEQWLSNRGVDQSCKISPFVDPTGQPAVLLKLNAHVACAMIDSLNEQHAHITERPGPPTPSGRFLQT